MFFGVCSTIKRFLNEIKTTLLLTEKIMRNYSGFYQDLSGYFIVFMNYVAALILTRKVILFQFVSDYAKKRGFLKPKFLFEVFFAIAHSILYYNKKDKKRFLVHKSR